MKTIQSSIEPLENRIAPAALVTAVYVEATDELTITGDVDDPNEVKIFQTGTDAYRVEGVATDINIIGTTFLDIGRLKKLTIIGGDETDNFTGINLKSLVSLSLSGGNGNDTFELENVVVKGPLTYHGGAGGDHLNFRGLSAEITGDLTADSAPGAGDSITVDFFSRDVTVKGNVFFTGGADSNDEFGMFGEGSATIGKGVNFNGGPGGGTLSLGVGELLSIGKLSTGESILMVAGADGNGGAISLGGATGIKLASGIRMTGDTQPDRIDIFSPTGTVKIGKLSTGRSILFDAGGGSDQITFDASVLSLSGALDMIGGDGNNSIEILTPNGTAKIGKLATGESIRITGTTGVESILTESSSLTLSGGILLDGGAGNNLINFQGQSGKVSIGKLKTGQSILYTGTTGTDRLLSDVASLTLSAGIEFNVGDGVNTMQFDGEEGFLKIGRLTGGQSILFNGGTSTDTLTVNVARVTLSGGVEFNGGGGVNHFDFNNAGVVTMGKFGTTQSVLFTGTGNADNELDIGGVSTLSGSIEMTGGTGSDDLDLDGRVSVGKNSAGISVSLAGGDGDDRLGLAGNMTLSGSLHLDGGNNNDTLDLNGLDTAVIKGSVDFTGGDGDDHFDLDAASLTISGGVTVTGGNGADTALFVADGSITGNVSVDLGVSTAGSQTFQFASHSGAVSGLLLKGMLTVDATAVSTADILTITNLSVKKLADIKLGDGVSTVNIDNLDAGDAFNLDTRGGGDIVNIERGNFFGNSTIKKLATIQTGSGDDFLSIGKPTPPSSGTAVDSTRVNFLGGMTADGGAGANDNRNDFATENTFHVPLTPPTGFEFSTLV